MILTCPSCATAYFVPDGAIRAEGRTVRCKACSHTWHAQASDEPLELSAQPVEPEPLAPEALAQSPAPELPKAFRARAEHQRRLRRAATHGAIWAGIASGFAALFGAAWLFRVEIVDIMPRTASAYAAIGAPVNPTGLDFEAVNARASPFSPDKVLISGALRNVRDNEVVAPAVRVALLDVHGAEIGHQVIRIDAAPVLPGGVQGFAAFVADPGGRARGVDVDFAPDQADTPADPVAARPATRPHTETAALQGPASDHASVGLRGALGSPQSEASQAGSSQVGGASHRPLPQADSGGLRPASAPGLHSAGNQAPVDATPIPAGATPAPHG